FHAVTQRPAPLPALVALVAVVAVLTLCAVIFRIWQDIFLGGVFATFIVIVLATTASMSLRLLQTEEVVLDGRALLIRRTFRGRARERSVRLSADCRALVSTDPRPKWGPGGHYSIVKLDLADGTKFFLGDGLNQSQQAQLALDINRYLQSLQSHSR
ncbi:MAG TPA: hypothetical protein VMI31_01890, partial [Fimbriimonadaceae bacterium]|nr:hypothetical protein [Fimbriimonadaceae bacterium]